MDEANLEMAAGEGVNVGSYGNVAPTSAVSQPHRYHIWWDSNGRYRFDNSIITPRRPRELRRMVPQADVEPQPLAPEPQVGDEPAPVAPEAQVASESSLDVPQAPNPAMAYGGDGAGDPPDGQETKYALKRTHDDNNDDHDHDSKRPKMER